MFINKTLLLNNLKPRAGINAKMSVSVICVKTFIYLLLYILHNRTFKLLKQHTFVTSAKHFSGLFQNIASTCRWMRI